MLNNHYPQFRVPEIKGKKAKHSVEILATLAIKGQMTTREIAKFVLNSTTEYDNQYPRDRDSRILEQIFYKLINGRGLNKKKYPGLADTRFVFPVRVRKNNLNNDVKTYFLTLKGSFFALGFQFDSRQLLEFVRNAAKEHLYFALLKKIIDDTSLEFVKSVLIEPAVNLIKDGLVKLDDRSYLNHILYAQQESISNKIYQLDENLFGSKKRARGKIGFRYYERMLAHVFYTDSPTSDWGDYMIEYFYPNSRTSPSPQFYDDRNSQLGLLYRFMRSIHFGYYSGHMQSIPKQTQRMPVSKEWREYRSYYPEYKSPQDRDRKKHIRIHY
jgi:hypothetical protein